jgi:hypothetical protein
MHSILKIPPRLRNDTHKVVAEDKRDLVVDSDLSEGLEKDGKDATKQSMLTYPKASKVHPKKP